MKQKILVIGTVIFALSFTLTGCNSSEEKVENAKENVVKANEYLEEAKEEYVNDIENYRKITAERTEENNQIIRDFNERKDEDKKALSVEYKLKMKELEDKNTDMEKTMEDYKANGSENWDKFKKEFNADMEDLGTAIKDVFVTEKK